MTESPQRVSKRSCFFLSFLICVSFPFAIDRASCVESFCFCHLFFCMGVSSGLCATIGSGEEKRWGITGSKNKCVVVVVFFVGGFLLATTFWGRALTQLVYRVDRRCRRVGYWSSAIDVEPVFGCGCKSMMMMIDAGFFVVSLSGFVFSFSCVFVIALGFPGFSSFCCIYTRLTVLVVRTPSALHPSRQTTMKL